MKAATGPEVRVVEIAGISAIHELRIEHQAVWLTPLLRLATGAIAPSISLGMN